MLLTYSFTTGVVLGMLNYLYFRKQGYTSASILILGIFAFSAIAFSILKYLL